MDGQIDQETKDRRAELVMQIQTGIMAQKQAEKVGQTVHVLCDGIDEESGYICAAPPATPLRWTAMFAFPARNRCIPASSTMFWWTTATFTICMVLLQNNKLEESV